MHKNTAKARMLAGRPAIRGMVTLGSPLAAAMLSQLGHDFVLVDSQHGAKGRECLLAVTGDLAGCYGTAEGPRVVGLVREPLRNQTLRRTTEECLARSNAVTG